MVEKWKYLNAVLNGTLDTVFTHEKYTLDFANKPWRQTEIQTKIDALEHINKKPQGYYHPEKDTEKINSIAEGYLGEILFEVKPFEKTSLYMTCLDQGDEARDACYGDQDFEEAECVAHMIHTCNEDANWVISDIPYTNYMRKFRK